MADTWSEQGCVRPCRILAPRSGSGWFWSEQLVITAAHFTGASGMPPEVVQTEHGAASVIWRDFDLDLAVLQIADRVPLGTSPVVAAARMAGEIWTATAFPESNPVGLGMRGTVITPSAGRFRNTRGLLELEYPVGRAADSVCGAPVVIDDHVVGVMIAPIQDGRVILAAPAEWLKRYCPKLGSGAARGAIDLVMHETTLRPEVEGAAALVGATVRAYAPASIPLLVADALAQPLFIQGDREQLGALAHHAAWGDVTLLGNDKPHNAPPGFIQVPTPTNGISVEDFQARIARRIIDLQRSPNVGQHLRSAISQIESRCAELLHECGSESVFMQFLAGWLSQIPGELPKHRATEFHASTRYYRGCLQDLNRWGSTRNAVAIADLSDDIEQWWLTNSAPDETSVRERIFLLNPTGVISIDNDQSWSNALACLAAEARRYDVYVARPPRAGTQHPLGEARAAWDIIVFPPDRAEPGVVGGYVSQPTNDNRTRYALRISRATDVVDNATKYYNDCRRGALRFDPAWTLDILRRRWVEHYGVGLWNGDWSDEIEGRDPKYFELYDEHIRCWVPHYDRLIRMCSTLVRREILDQTASSPASLSVLELGYGTGALTEKVTSWLTEYRSISTALQSTHVDVWGIDRSDEMQRRARARVEDAYRKQLVTGTFPRTPPEELPLSYRANVIFGSLVLHDIWAKPNGLDDMFETCAKKFLHPRGTLIFADVLFRENGSEREDQVRYWTERIRRTGVDEKQIEFFFSRNREMREESPSVADLVRIAGKYGFACVDVKQAANERNPFGVICFRGS